MRWRCGPWPLQAKPGHGCGTIRQGRHVVYPKDTPLNNLWLAMLNRMEIKVQQLGDSSGELPGLA